MNMYRFGLYLCMVATLTVGAITIFSLPQLQVYAPPAVAIDIPPAASSASSTSPTAIAAATTTPVKVHAPTIASTKKKTAPAPAPTPEPARTVPVIAPTHVATDAALDAAASVLRSALVNIYCRVPAKSGLHSISGSGVFIDSKGIILTNAHVAEYFLLADRGVSCTIRTGGPATDAYKAALIYISPMWLHTNPNVLTEENPSGDGRYDFALLTVAQPVGTSASSVLPSVFPSIPLAQKPPAEAGTPVVIASYGAQFIASSQIVSALFPTIVFGSVKDVYTFENNTIDILALGGSVAAQEGSSGGGVADASGALTGTITTSTITGATDTRLLNALSASYIRAEYASETGRALDLLLAAPTTDSIVAFAPKIPDLEAFITTNL